MMKAIFTSAIFCVGGLSAAHAEIQTTCPGRAQNLSLQLEAEVQIRDEETASPTFFEDSIQQQLRFFKNHLKSQIEEKGAQLVFAEANPQLSDIHREKIKTPFAWSVQEVKHPDVKINQPYLKSALGRRDLAAGAPAWRIRYTAEISALLCQKKEASEIDFTQFKALAPVDPWLAHWLVSLKKFRHVQWKKSNFLIPPYFDSEYADIPHPEFAWYFWRPDYQGVDSKGQIYRADTSWEDPARVVGARISLKHNQSLSPFASYFDAGTWAAKPELRATVVFGVTSPKLKQMKWQSYFARHSRGGAREWAGIEKALRKVNAQTNLDEGASYASGFLINQYRFARPDSFRYEYRKSENLLRLQGLLRRSGKAFRIHFYFGPTDLLAGAPPAHWDIAREGLLYDDLIFYIGHSGLGENLKWQNILDLGQKKNLAPVARNDRIIGIFSCYSYSYFDQDMSRFLGKNAYLILTGSSYTSARGPVGILDWVDKSLVRTDGEIVAFTEAEDFLIFKKMGGEANAAVR